ncbi:aspartate-alanine antiporter [Bauldia sp.]|uniref:aspartate-alanine antiporter n=1 Tax=Bauldia sp. TaxID=2575872 RepID=UPI003BAB2BE5
MQFIDEILKEAPLVVIFITVAVGFFIGKFTVGRFVLGGIAGTLIAGVVIGQIGVDIDPGIKNIFFALFIYAVGYQGGPQFFNALNPRTLNQLASAFVMTLVGLGCVLAAALLFDLDRGTAAGLAAGGLTQSAIIGTAGDAVARLDVSPDLIKQMQTNIAVGYAVCYIFGSLGPIIMVTWFWPSIMKWDIRQEAVKLSKVMSGGRPELDPGQFNMASRVGARFYHVDKSSKAVGQTALDVDRALDLASVEAIVRGGEVVPLADDLPIQADDIVAITGRVEVLQTAGEYFGHEVVAPADVDLIEEERRVVITNRKINGHTLQQIHDHVDISDRRGIFLAGVNRTGAPMPLYPNLALHTGDELLLIGRTKDLDRVQAQIGYKISAARVTDFVFFGLGMAIGFLIGLIEFRVFGVPVTIGSGGGCLLSGLFFGWLRSVHPAFAALPLGASNYLRDFGLAVFVGVVGLSAGPAALTTLETQGLTLFLLGVGVTLIPMLIVLPFSYYVLRIRNPIEALGCMVGGRSANPGFAALLDKAGNATPVVSFTVTYAVANVFLTLWGPLIIGIISKNPS